MLIKMKKVKSWDNINVIAWKFKGTNAVVEKVEEEKVFLKWVNVVKKAVKGKGFVEKTLPIHISNVMHDCKKCKKPVRVSIVTNDKWQTVRVCKKCGTEIK